MCFSFIEKNILLPILLSLFNKIFENGTFPNDWSEVYIIPLHKKGSRSEAEITEALHY